LLEQEAKFRLDSAEDGLARIRAASARLEVEEAFESNRLFDFDDGRLAQRDEVLRIRRFAGDARLTWKGAQQGSSTLKERRELEVSLADTEATILEEILIALGLTLTFRYDKYRSYYRLDDAEIALDRTPMGVFLEIEGTPDSIRGAAGRMSLDLNDSITSSYPRLYEMYRSRVTGAPRFMVFPEDFAGSRSG
jgi:adenylate cyclase class 2